MIEFQSGQITAFFMVLAISALENSSHSDWGCEVIFSSNR